MSMHEPLFGDYPIPQETYQIAHRAFPKGNLVMQIRDHFGMLYHNHQFAHLFASEGQPALAPARLSLVTVMQYIEGVGDHQAADNVRDRISWKYALGLALDDPGFDFSVFYLVNVPTTVAGTEHLVNTRRKPHDPPPQIEAFWQAYLATRGDLPPPLDYDPVWQFGNLEAAGRVGQLTKEGIKTTTSSLLWHLEHIGESVPQVGACGIVADGGNNPICILELTEVEIRPFNEVDAQFAYDYVEYGRTLA